MEISFIICRMYVYPHSREILFVDFNRPIFPIAEEEELMQTVARIDPSCKQAQ